MTLFVRFLGIQHRFNGLLISDISRVLVVTSPKVTLFQPLKSFYHVVVPKRRLSHAVKQCHIPAEQGHKLHQFKFL